MEVMGIPEIWHMIFGHLELQDLVVCTMVCRTWTARLQADTYRQRMYLDPIDKQDARYQISPRLAHEQGLCRYWCDDVPGHFRYDEEESDSDDEVDESHSLICLLNPLLATSSTMTVLSQCNFSFHWSMRHALADILPHALPNLLSRELVHADETSAVRRPRGDAWHDTAADSWLDMYATQPPISSMSITLIPPECQWITRGYIEASEGIRLRHIMAAVADVVCEDRWPLSMTPKQWFNDILSVDASPGAFIFPFYRVPEAIIGSSLLGTLDVELWEILESPNKEKKRTSS